jgi:hypothetical protein
MDKTIIRVKDLVELYVDSVGFIATPSADEPLPEESEAVSHLRLIQRKDNQYNSDFVRCLFRIETELVQVRNLHILRSPNLLLPFIEK